MNQIIAVALLASLLAPPALADQMTVAELQQICAGKTLDTQNACRFYVLGVVEGASFGEGSKTVAGPLCIASDVQSTALVDAVKKLMQADLLAYPQDKSLAAAGFVAAAAMKAFPCKK